MARLYRLMDGAKSDRVELIAFPELALTSFFPRWMLDEGPVLDAYYEHETPEQVLAPLINRANRSRIGFTLGYAERQLKAGFRQRFNTSVLFDPCGTLVGKYRKIHLPGDRAERAGATFQHLEKRYFDTGNLGFPTWKAFGGIVGMLICNDRRWPEAWRVLGLQAVELVLIGYNTPLHNPEAPEHDRVVAFQHALVIQAGCYQNSTWAVAAGKAGVEEGQAMLAESMIVAPSGEIVAKATTDGDELVVAEIDLDLTRSYKTTIFDFGAHRQPQAYRMIVERNGAVPPAGLD
jgi:N-carbamoyl-D-amino-acid hydrolase